MKNKKEIFSNVFITNENAIFFKKTKTTIVADLHIGFEAEKQIQGISFPFFQKNILIEKLGLIIEKYSPQKIIIDGDFKHNFSKNLKQEWNEVIEILKFLKNKANVILIKGNHDNFLRTIANQQNVKLVNFYFIEDFLLIHGHEDLEKEIIGGSKNLSTQDNEDLNFQINLRRKFGNLKENKKLLNLDDKLIKFQKKFEKDNENKKFAKSITPKNFEKNLILAHEHPSIKLRDELGVSVKLPCFLINKKRKIIVLPAFSPLALGQEFSITKKYSERTDISQLTDKKISKKELNQKSSISEYHSKKYATSNEFLSPILKKFGYDEIVATSEIGLLEF